MLMRTDPFRKLDRFTNATSAPPAGRWSCRSTPTPVREQDLNLKRPKVSRT